MYQAIILGSVLLVTLYVLKRMHDPKLNMPPLVRYKYPIIGHTYSYLFNCEEFLMQCRKEYGDIFSLYIWGQVRVFVGKEHIKEVLSKSDVFSFSTAFSKTFPEDELFKMVNIVADTSKIFKIHVLNKLEFYTGRMQTSLYSATQKYLDGCDEPKVFDNFHGTIAKIIAIPVANILIGEEESQCDEIIATFTELTRDLATIMRIPPFLDLIYPGLQSYVNRIPIKLGLFNPAAKHRKVLIKNIKNQVCKRLQEKEKHGDSWKRPNDFLQDLIEEESFDPNNVDYLFIAEIILTFIFAAIHTTSSACANSIMDLASRPQYIQELYEEQLKVHEEADKNGILPFEALEKMKKLDSFIRESMRLTGNIAGLQHYVLKDYTFSNGLQVPENCVVDLYFDDIYRDESLQGPNPKSFEPFRHLEKNVPATKISRSYLSFGGGKHACPGRHFSINEIKFFMHNIILKYNFRTESGKIEEKRRFGPANLPSTSGIIFERRNKLI